MSAYEAVADAQDWSPSYGGERMTDGIDYGWQMRDHVARYHYVKAACQGLRVLDAATGSGYGADILRSGGAREVVAVDRDERAIGYARERYGTQGISWRSCDAEDMPFEAEFDVVVSFETIEHLPRPEQFVRECRRALKPGGLYIVSTPLNLGGPYCSIHHTIEYSPSEFAQLLSRHFSQVELFGQRRVLSAWIRPFGRWPDWYRDKFLVRGKGNPLMHKIVDRLNKAPDHALAWALGYSEQRRSEIRRLQEPAVQSPLLSPNYYAMIAFCRV
jgi:2-polyprenyl-3-methyl-5-hydroxy-6-metoxy-1,4-benzoquinol methylase